MRILGIDPGIERVGWGVLDASGHNFVPVDFGCIITPRNHALPQRILAIYLSVKKIMGQLQPDVVAVEEIFFAKNAKTAISVGHARGVCLLAAAENDVSVEEVTPLQVKSTVVGYGSATKDQVGIMVSSLLGLSKVPRPDDTADALAIAVTAGIKRSFGARLASSVSRTRPERKPT